MSGPYALKDVRPYSKGLAASQNQRHRRYLAGRTRIMLRRTFSFNFFRLHVVRERSTTGDEELTRCSAARADMEPYPPHNDSISRVDPYKANFGMSCSRWESFGDA